LIVEAQADDGDPARRQKIAPSRRSRRSRLGTGRCRCETL
jgi:hypothetical protein